MPEYGRRLPHFHPADAYLFLTWRLYESLPRHSEPQHCPTPGHTFVVNDRALDRLVSGPRWLKDPPLADLVANAILTGASERKFYELYAWTVMPNHVHLLIQPLAPVPVLMR